MEHNIHDRRAPHGPRFANIDAGGDGKISLQAGCIDRSPRAFWPSLDATRVVSCRFRLHAFGSRFTLHRFAMSVYEVLCRSEHARTCIQRLEFLYFARQNLHLTAYDVGDMELKQFYKSPLPRVQESSLAGRYCDFPRWGHPSASGMDRNGDGVDAEELLNFIKEQHAELSGRKAP